MRHFWGITPARRLSGTTTPHATTPTSSVRQHTSMAGTAPVTGHHTPYEALHPLWASAPVMGLCTRSEGVQCLRIGCSTTLQQAALRRHALTHPRDTLSSDPTAPPKRNQIFKRTISKIQPDRERSTRSERVESSRSGVTPHRQQACAGSLADTAHVGIQQAQVEQRCTA